jgi:acetate kinase
MDAQLLTINGGSSSLKFAVFRAGAALERLGSGTFERIGHDNAQLTTVDPNSGAREEQRLSLPDHAACVPLLVDLLAKSDAPLKAIGHRVVHGGTRHRDPELVTTELLADLRTLSPFAPEHEPAEIALMEACAEHYPDVPQVACFDTAFHADLPRVAQLLPVPRRYNERGVRRYGFHGISYTYLMQELERVAGRAAARGRVILAHLGNGASMAAVHNGRCVDTTMAFTPAAGLVMGTRSGDLDPGLVAFLARTEGMSALQFDALVNRESGLLGLSESSADMRDLLGREADDVRAAEAVAVFCYQAKKWIGAPAALGGLDTLVSPAVSASTLRRCAPASARPAIRRRSDAARNDAARGDHLGGRERAVARVIPTDEERLIAGAAQASRSAPSRPHVRRCRPQ